MRLSSIFSGWSGGTILNVVQTIAIITSIAIATVMHRSDQKAAGVERSARMMIDFTDRLYKAPAADVTWALEVNGSLDRTNVSEEAIDDFLSKYELLSLAYRYRIINDDMASDTFAYPLAEGLKDAKIRKYILDSRKAPTTNVYDGVLEMARCFGIDTSFAPGAPPCSKLKEIPEGLSLP